MSGKEQESNSGNMSKLERYKWSDPGKPGRFQVIHKDQLVIPVDSYQREASGGDGDKKVLRIAANFSWVAFQVVSVVERDGVFYVLDSGHRVRAARKREDIQMLPCMIYELDSIVDEAKAFDVINSNRKPMSAVDRHQAHIVQGDDVAKKAEKYALAAGRVIGKKTGAGSIACVNDLKKCIREDDKSLSSVWPVVVELCEGHGLTQDILNGLYYIERRASEPASSKRIRGKIMQIGYEGIARAAKEGAAYNGARSGKNFAEGIMKAINKGFQKKLEMVQ